MSKVLTKLIKANFFWGRHTVDASEIRLITWDVKKPINNEINYQPQLVSLPDFKGTINCLDG